MKTTLIDGNGAMLAAAIEHAADIGLATDRTHAHVQYVQELGELAGVDLVVMPNAALNQLTCQTPRSLSCWQRSTTPYDRESSCSPRSHAPTPAAG